MLRDPFGVTFGEWALVSHVRVPANAVCCTGACANCTLRTVVPLALWGLVVSKWRKGNSTVGCCALWLQESAIAILAVVCFVANLAFQVRQGFPRDFVSVFSHPSGLPPIFTTRHHNHNVRCAVVPTHCCGAVLCMSRSS